MLERFHLLIIREVQRQGSLTAAASELFLTQSALSHTVKKLEQQLGTPIRDREGRSLRLTQAGRYLLTLAEQLLPQFEHAEARMKQYANGERGTLRIGMECHPCFMLQMVANNRGVAALPRWLAEEYADRMAITAVKLGKNGIAKRIFLGTREADGELEYLVSFVDFARRSNWQAPRMRR
ncbi:LysR family transcriptional regulator [Burkholderia sp. Ac-20353]|uniref:LysR family transcriptional regulator n=1 Tax=Burkholderia sp. Ac-20353 TaxID=2703894 RepID=UPI00197B2FE0|nr:LysR family transcriptional regulator [Burkholderia sp. Ac-20353]MBN3785395.1 LysR family transcriptional regulator [Burkholderia sp. Ac-20353]